MNFEFRYRKMENFRVQFSRNFAVGRDLRKLKSAKYFSSLFKVKAIIYKRLKIPFCSSYFLYINQTKRKCDKDKAYVMLLIITIN